MKDVRDDLTTDEEEVRPLEELEGGYPLWWLDDGAAVGLHEDLNALEPVQRRGAAACLPS